MAERRRIKKGFIAYNALDADDATKTDFGMGIHDFANDYVFTSGNVTH